MEQSCANLGEVLGDRQVMIPSVAHAAVAARPEVLASHAQHAPVRSLASVPHLLLGY